MTNKPTVAEAIVACLVRHGVTTLFSQSLPSAILLAAEDAGIRQYAYRQENAGAIMADAYARVSNRAAVVTAQNGPAATLLVPGLAEALKASVPVVALVQDVNRAHAERNAFQELDHLKLFQACTKWVARVTEPGRAVDMIDLAFAQANSGRPGPVALMLPADLLIEPLDPVPSPRGADLGRFPLDPTGPDPARLAEAADLLASARKPLIVAGGGVHLSGAAQAMATLQENAQIPVMTTVMGKGAVDERHPLSMGIGGYALGRLAPARHLRPLIEEADVILLVGTRTNQNGTDGWTLYPSGARYIHIDVDGAEIGRNYESLRLAGDARLVLTALADALKGRRGPNPEAIAAIARGRDLHTADIAAVTDPARPGPARPERLMADLQTLLTPDTIVAADASYSSLWVACYLQALAPGMRFLTPRGLAGLGWGLPLAMGAKLARPEAPVFCVVGDGGFAHVWSEMETARRNGTKIVVTVLNNGVLGYQKDAEDVKFNRHTTACYFAEVDHAAIARATGCHGIRVEQPDDYMPALRAALDHHGTTVIDVLTDPSAYPPVTFFDPLNDIRRQKASAP